MRPSDRQTAAGFSVRPAHRAALGLCLCGLLAFTAPAAEGGAEKQAPAAHGAAGRQEPAAGEPAAAAQAAVRWQLAATGPPYPLDRPRCEGTAPQDPGCIQSWTLTGSFVINIQLAITYLGSLEIHVFTETGFTTVICVLADGLYGDCPFVHGGVFVVGQQATMVVVASGRGFWRVFIS